MMLFLADISMKGMESISGDYERGDYCHQWQGVECINHHVDKIHFTAFPHGNFNLRALPHSTTSICIRNCKQTFEIQTRSLPQKLVFLSLILNKIWGRVDLTTLPPVLTTALLQRNKLTGPIKLTNLPESLYTLNLQYNNIQQEVVWYDNLPKTIRRIKLAMNGIGAVRAVNSANRAKRSIFPKMRKRNIH